MAGMADAMPVLVPTEFTRIGNIDHIGMPKPITEEMRFSYGTAGFREHADRMAFIAYRIGYLASLRARITGKAVGVMITASHNPEQDNGVKIIDPDGEMLAEEWEDHATELVKCKDLEFPTGVRSMETNLNPDRHATGIVLVGRDTRTSGRHLRDAVLAGVALFKTSYKDEGVLTTPQLHYLVYASNHSHFGFASEEGYYDHFSVPFHDVYELIPPTTKYVNKLHLDCANGVGAQQMRKFEAKLPEGALSIDFHNELGPLNYRCGADFVKISRETPDRFETVPVNERCAVFDGDADRLVYFYKKEDGKIELLDGDKIAVLIAKFYKDHLAEIKEAKDLSFAIVQTAYANGNSSRYMRETLGTSPIFVPTGVKHLHHEAAKYDCAIYFEANGHGTATFSDRFFHVLKSSKTETAKRLTCMSELINKIVGDAMTDLLAVELILRHYDWTVQDWAAIYEDAPSKQLKIPVVDRSLFHTTPDETRLVNPADLQTTIDNLVGKRNHARAFVRPSGTENIVRVYAESTTQKDADELAKEIGEAVNALGL